MNQRAEEIVRLARTGEGSSRIGWFRVKNTGDFPDSVECVSYAFGPTGTVDGEIEGTTLIQVAKPYELRRTPHHGKTVNGVSYTYSGNVKRTARKGGLSEVQIVTPPYYIGLVILACRDMLGGTGVKVDDKSVVWEELPGRHFGAEAAESQVAASPENGLVLAGGLQNNFAAERDPGLGDDRDHGYAAGSLWINLLTAKMFFCVNPSTNAAQWAQAGGGGGGAPGGSNTQLQYNNAGAFGGTSGFTWNGIDAMFAGGQALIFRQLGMGIASTAPDVLSVVGVLQLNLYGDTIKLHDQVGNTMAAFVDPTGAIVNYLEFRPSIAGSPLLISAIGTDANISIRLAPKGAAGLLLGDGTAGIDYVLTFDGETNDGVMTWMEDEDYFAFSDDALFNTTEKLYFRDTALFIGSSVDGQLDISADVLLSLGVDGDWECFGATLRQFRPAQDRKGDLGTAAKEWNDLYAARVVSRALCTEHLIAKETTIPAATSVVLSRYVEIAAGITLTIEVDGDLEIL